MFRFLVNAFNRLFRRGRWRVPRPEDIPLFEMSESSLKVSVADIREARSKAGCSDEDNDTVCHGILKALPESDEETLAD